jgi:SAM-dependent methyltransferase
MTATLACPVHGAPLSAQLDCPHGESYPAVGGIPVLLADERERAQVVRGDIEGATPLRFYNRTDDHDSYCRSELVEIQRDLAGALAESRASGPVLEIGSGKGALQGTGVDYVACDYSLSALATYLRPEHQRVCASAERLPFPDATFRFVFTVAALEHVPQADLAFAEIERVLAPGGVAYLAPAWHCVQWNCEGIPVRAYSELSLRQKLVKLSLPLRQSLPWKAATSLPARALRRALWSLRPLPTALRFTRLRPDYETFWMSDSDAAARIDSHEGCLFFESRGYEVLRPGPGAAAQLLARHHAVVVRKPVAQPTS